MNQRAWRIAMLAAPVLLVAAIGIDLHFLWQTDPRPERDPYGAAVYRRDVWFKVNLLVN